MYRRSFNFSVLLYYLAKKIMIAILRCLFIPCLFIIFCLFGILLCLSRPRHPNNTKLLAVWLSRLFAPVLGIKLIVRIPSICHQLPSVLIANHQSNFDLVCFGPAFLNNTLCIGKQSIRWIPVFGQVFWLAGNLFIDRKNQASAKNTLQSVSHRIKNNKISIWLFPEGTRSNGKGLLNFKMGAFHTAIQANVAIVPVVLSTTTAFKLNKFNNGHAIVKVLNPIQTANYDNSKVKSLALISHNVIRQTIALLDQEVQQLNQAKRKADT